MNEAVQHLACQHLQLESHRIRECNHFETHNTGDAIDDGALYRYLTIASLCIDLFASCCAY